MYQSQFVSERPTDHPTREPADHANRDPNPKHPKIAAPARRSDRPTAKSSERG